MELGTDMKFKITSILSVIILTLFLFGCAENSKDAPALVPDSDAVSTDKETPVTQKAPEATSAPGKETEQSPVTDALTDAPPQIETVGEEIVWTPVTEVVEEVIFGEPDTTAPYSEQNDPPAPVTQESFTSRIPEQNGTAPVALMYHLILDEPYIKLESLFVRPSELRGHIEALLEKGYTFIFADEYDYYDGKTVIMSFDDGYIDNYTEAFPIIKKYNVKVTIFMISNYINCPEYLTEGMIREMASSGLVSFQSHTASHAYLTGLSEESLKWEFATSKSVIESLTGRPVKALCYPTGAHNATVERVASEYFDFAYTTSYSNTTAGYPVLELPRIRVSRGFSKEYFSYLIP